MQNNELIKFEACLIKCVDNTIGITNKLLALSDPQLIPYRKGKKWGFCTYEKQIVIVCEFDEVKKFTEGASVVMRFGKYGFIETNGKITNNGLLRHFGCLNSLNEGAAIANLKVNNKIEKWGFVNKKNSDVTEFIYDRVNDFSEGLAGVKFKGKWGFINKNNSIAIPFSYDQVKDFSEGLAGVRFKGKWGFINKNNSIVIPFSYDDVHCFCGGFTNVEIGEKWGYIDTKGSVIIPVEIETLEILFSLTGNSEKSTYPEIINLESKYCLIDQNNEPLSKMRYDCIDYRGYGFCNELIDVELNGEWGFINTEGEQVIPCIYDEVFPFIEGLAGVLKNDYWGFINTEGEQVIPCIYDEVIPFYEGLAEVYTYRNGEYLQGFINKYGIEYWED
jgi:hypothetical protein